MLLLSSRAPQLEKDLRRHSRESAKWRIETTSSVASLISTYESLAPDLIVLDPAEVGSDLETLLEHAKHHWPRTFFSLLSDQPEESFRAAFERFGSLPMIAPGGPADVSREIEKEMVGLVNGTLQGLMLSSFLQMMEWESKSVSIHVSAAERWGRLHLYQGKFVSAYVQGKTLTDEEAAIEILTWDNISIAVERSYHNQKHASVLPLSSLIMDAMVRKDEAALNEPPSEELVEEANEELGDEFLLPEEDLAPHHFLTEELFSEDAFAQPQVPVTLPGALTVAEEIDDDEMELYIIQNSVSVPSKEIEKKLLSKPNSRDILVGDILSIDGAVAAALVDASSGMTLDMAGAGIDLELAGAGMTEVVRAQQRAMELLSIKGPIEDLMVTLERQYHLMYMLPGTPLFLYVVLRKEQANLAMARYRLKAAASALHL